jgi:hypothetical protein
MVLDTLPEPNILGFFVFHNDLVYIIFQLFFLIKKQDS